jgi:hypothetical protein
MAEPKTFFDEFKSAKGMMHIVESRSVFLILLSVCNLAIDNPPFTISFAF